MSYDNGTGVFSFSFNDPLSRVSSGCLRVVKEGWSSSVVCESCVSSYFGDLSCPIDLGVDGNYLASGSVVMGGQEFGVVEASHQVNNGSDLGSLGLIFSILLIAFLTFMFSSEGIGGAWVS